MTMRHRLAATLALLSAAALAACGGDSATGPAPTATLSIANGANVPITGVYFSACTDEGWGDDRLAGAEAIAPGQERTWTLAPGCWDVRASTGSKSGFWYDREIGAGETLEVELSAAANELVVRAGRAGAKAR